MKDELEQVYEDIEMADNVERRAIRVLIQRLQKAERQIEILKGGVGHLNDRTIGLSMIGASAK